MTTVPRTASAVAALGLAMPAMAQDIIVVSHGQANDPFWSVVENGVDPAAEHTGANLECRAPEECRVPETFDMVVMSQPIDAAVNQEPDGPVVSIPDCGALGPSIERAVAAGIPVISMNSGSDVADELGAALRVGQSQRDAGMAAGERLAEMGGTSAIRIDQEVGFVPLDPRREGFAEGFGGTVEVLPAFNDRIEIESRVSAALASNEDVDAIMALGAGTAGQPAVAANASGLDIMVAYFDLSASLLESIAAGDAAFAVDKQQFLQGYPPVVFLAANLPVQLPRPRPGRAGDRVRRAGHPLTRWAER
jgi:simple sugar transport system substrate-binding protein